MIAQSLNLLNFDRQINRLHSSMSYNRLILRLVTCIATRVLKDVVFKERVWFFRAAAASPVEGMVKHGGNLKDIHMEALGSKNAPL